MRTAPGSGVLPLDGRGFRLSMGLRRTDARDWLEPPGAEGAGELAERARLLAEVPHDVVAWLADEATLAACTELLSLLPAGPVDAEHPIRSACLRVPEDICVLDPGGVVVAGAVCFPNRWRIADKVGLPLAGVHAPVPGYADELAARVDTVVARLRPGEPLERRNWAVLDDPALHQPHERTAAPLDVSDVGTRLWVRVERQALRRLPSTGATVFTIRTRQWRLDQLAADDRGALADALRTMPADTAAYKGVASFADAAVSWLDATRRP